MMFPYYAVPWASPVPAYQNGSLAFVDDGFEIDWARASNFSMSADKPGTFDAYPIPNYKWSDFFKKYFKVHSTMPDIPGAYETGMKWE